MAQLALGAAGALVGNMIAPGIGGQIGFMVGSLAGGYIDRAMQKPVQGPRLSDLSVASSAYGNAIPEIQGTVRLAGNVIWSTGLIERKKKTGGKTGPKQELYTYQASFAAAFCAGPTSRVLRLWLDKKLAYDCTSSGETIGVKGLIWRFYSGSEVQLPDPAIVAKDGANAPAHRGLCYVVFDSVPLEQFGNRLPNIEAEICTDATDANTTTTVVNLSTANGNPFSSPTHVESTPAVDWERRLAVRGYTQSGVYGVGVSDVSSGVELRVKTLTDMFAGTGFTDYGARPGILALTPAGAGYYARGPGNPQTQLVRFDPETLTITGQHPTNGGFGDDYERIEGCGEMSTTRILREGAPRELVLYTSIYGNIRIIDADAMVSIWGMSGARSGQPAIIDAPSFPFRGSLSESNAHMCGGEQRLDETDVWILTSNKVYGSGTVDDRKPRLQRVRVGATAAFYEVAGQTSGIIYEQIAILDPATIHPGATSVGVGCLQYDPSDNCLVFVSQLGTGTGDAIRLVKIDDTGALVWTVAINANPLVMSGTARLDGTMFPQLAGSTGQLVDLRSGAVTTFTLSGHSNVYVADSESRSTVFQSGTSTLKRYYYGRATGAGLPLSSVASWLCGKAGLTAGQIDTTLLSGSVRGFIRGQEPLRDSLTVLQSAFFFDAIEEDGVLRFRHRGGATVASVAFAQVLRQTEDQPAFTIRQADDTELPRRLWVDYRDAERDQQSNAMSFSRAMAPTVIANGRQESRLNLSALVLTASEAKTIAMRHLLAAYAGRFTIEGLGLTYEHLRLNAGDPITLELNDGTLQRVVFRRSEIGADYSLAVEAVFEDGATFALSTTGSSGDGYAAQAVPSVYPSRLLWANLPLLADVDDIGGTGLRFYAAAGGYGDGWLGAGLFTSADRATWDRVSTLRTSMVWGTALATLPAPSSAFLTDRTSTLRLVIQAGVDAIETATEEQMLNGANRALLISSDGSAEMIGFANVTANADGSITLDTFLRGLRGTEWACTGHAPGDLFVLVDDTFEEMALPLSALGASRYGRAVGRFDTFDAIAPIGRTITGAAEKPYAPVQIVGARDGSNNLTVTWERRSRIGGEWMDGGETVPLGEASEAYVVEILNGSGTVLRTITGLTTTSASYTAAQQTTDFGSAQSAIAVRVYQISATVGRGYAGSATV